MNTGLDGKVAVVTGAGGGIGSEIARALAREGCDLCLLDLEVTRPLEVLAAELREGGSRVSVMPCDVRDFERSAVVVRRIIDEMGALHLLVCSAGITRDAVVWKMQEAAWDDVMDANVKGCFTMIRAAVPTMREQMWGRVVAVSSINGLRGKFGQSNYSASKAGVIGLVKAVAREVGKFGITVNAVAPGMVMTEMAARLPERFVAGARADAVLDHLTEPEDVADSVVFLCSDRARAITGEVLRVDCGQYI